MIILRRLSTKILFVALGSAIVATLFSLATFVANASTAGNDVNSRPLQSASPRLDPTLPCNWEIVSSPDPAGNGAFNNLAIISANDIWAVGVGHVGFNSYTLTEHWDGTSWSIVTSPDPSPEPNPAWNALGDVSALASTDVWAAGYYWDTPDTTHSLLMQWNGVSWNIIPSPNPGTRYNDLTSIKALAPNDIWTVGRYQNTGLPGQTLTMHWDGTAWNVIPSPNLGLYTNILRKLAVISTTDIWAVGDYEDTQGIDYGLIEHWNGSSWTLADSGLSGVVSGLYAATAISQNNAWAFGYYYTGSQQHILTLHWDGVQWNIIPAPDPSPNGGYLAGAFSLLPNDIWATGSFYDPGTGVNKTLIMHWDGVLWSIAPSPSPGDDSNALGGIVAVDAGNMWTVGAYVSGSQHTLVLHLDGPCSTPTPGTPQPTWTQAGTRTRTPTPTITRTTTSTPTHTVQPSITPTSLPGPSCPVAFEDLMPSDPGFSYAHCATCNNIMESFACGQSPSEACIPPTNYPYFRPNVGFSATYAEVAKTLSQAAGFSDPAADQVFEDVPPGHPYFQYIGRMGERYLMVGFACGGPGEPCVPPFNRPYFRPDAHSESRGKFSHHLSDTAGFSEPAVNQLFEDVPNGYPDSEQINRIAARGIMNGFPCGGPGEPCIPPANLPYFRPNVLLSSVSRLEYATILITTFQPACPPAATPTRTPTGTRTPPPSATRTMTWTPTPTPTSSPTPDRTSSITPSTPPTATPIPPTPTNTPMPTTCPIQFTDVQPGSTFYDFIRCLACRGIINGYSDGTFKPNNNVTRGQLSKIISNAVGFNNPQTTQMFQDVPTNHTFFVYIGRLASRGYIGGYACGGPGEPCVAPANQPYFRPNNNATRGQISKIVSNAAGFADPPSGQQFEDVPVGNTYYTYIYRLVTRSIMGGYQCGGPGEPCILPNNYPYFRPNANATRGQTSKIVANTVYPSCQTPEGVKR